MKTWNMKLFPLCLSSFIVYKFRQGKTVFSVQHNKSVYIRLCWDSRAWLAPLPWWRQSEETGRCQARQWCCPDNSFSVLILENVLLVLLYFMWYFPFQWNDRGDNNINNGHWFWRRDIKSEVIESISELNYFIRSVFSQYKCLVCYPVCVWRDILNKNHITRDGNDYILLSPGIWRTRQLSQPCGAH